MHRGSLLMSENVEPPPDSATLATICESAGKPPGTVMSHTVSSTGPGLIMIVCGPKLETTVQIGNIPWSSGDFYSHLTGILDCGRSCSPGNSGCASCPGCASRSGQPRCSQPDPRVRLGLLTRWGLAPRALLAFRLDPRVLVPPLLRLLLSVQPDPADRSIQSLPPDLRSCRSCRSGSSRCSRCSCWTLRPSRTNWTLRTGLS